VCINDYQSGGYMWYAVFNRSMVALMAGVLTLLGYLGIRETFFSGPFYLLAPLPFCITYFWYKCEDRFKTASMVIATSWKSPTPSCLLLILIHASHRVCR
jgi:hypothetical protein